MQTTFRSMSMSMAGAFALVVALTAAPVAAQADDSSQSQIQRGYEINPVPLNLQGKNRALVGLGSYIINTGACIECHTHPSYLPGGSPYLGQPEHINVDQFMTGGRKFGPFTAANLTPDALGRPAGLTLDEFISVLRTGHDPDAPAGSLLQIMPWPSFGKKTDMDLRAMYEYLSAIPSKPDNPNPGP